MNDAFRKLFYYCWLQPLGTAGFSTARRTKLSDCCFGKLNDLKQTQPDCAAILGNAMTLTALLSAKLCSSVVGRSKSLLILKITYLKAQLILLAVPLKGQLQCSKGYLPFRICQVVALHVHQCTLYSTGQVSSRMLFSPLPPKFTVFSPAPFQRIQVKILSS